MDRRNLALRGRGFNFELCKKSTKNGEICKKVSGADLMFFYGFPNIHKKLLEIIKKLTQESRPLISQNLCTCSFNHLKELYIVTAPSVNKAAKD